jgi:hypothetical protein
MQQSHLIFEEGMLAKVGGVKVWELERMSLCAFVEAITSS